LKGALTMVTVNRSATKAASASRQRHHGHERGAYQSQTIIT
jgi:hypothetical protein